MKDTPTPQQKALAEMTRKYGNTAFTKDTVHYRLVGCKQFGVTIASMGETWSAAMDALAARMVA